MPAEFKKIFLPCHQRLYAAAWRLTGNQQEAEDLVQDTLLRLWTKREDITVPDKAEAFAVTALRNLFYDKHRKKHLQKTTNSRRSTRCVPTETQRRTAGQDEVGRVQQIIDRLPEKQRLVITLHDIDNLSYEEIEAQTGLNAVNVRVALSRARKGPVREPVLSALAQCEYY
jgi:RNA polymerase sigma-70 factor (ECF subfamily)